MCAFLSLSVMVFIRQKISQYKGRIAAYRKVRLTTLGTSKQKKISFLKGIMKEGPQKRAELVPLLKCFCMIEVSLLFWTGKSPLSSEDDILVNHFQNPASSLGVSQSQQQGIVKGLVVSQ